MTGLPLGSAVLLLGQAADASATASWRLLCLLTLVFCGGGGASPAPSAPVAAPVSVPASVVTPQELQCRAAGWARDVVVALGLQRLVPWKALPAWTRGAIIAAQGLDGPSRRADLHDWLDDYNAPLLDFFASRLR